MIEKPVPFCIKPIFGSHSKWHNIKLLWRVTRHIYNFVLFGFNCLEDFCHKLNPLIFRNATICIIQTIFSFPESVRILVKYSFLVEFGGQIYIGNRDLALLSNLQHPLSPSQAQHFCIFREEFWTQSSPFSEQV